MAASIWLVADTPAPLTATPVVPPPASAAAAATTIAWMLSPEVAVTASAPDDTMPEPEM